MFLLKFMFFTFLGAAAAYWCAPKEEDTQLNQLKSLSAAMLQCLKDTQKPKNTTDVVCPGLFDNVMCWPDTKAGTTAKQRCPSYVFGFNTSGYAVKECLATGEWYINPVKNMTYTNFTGCIPKVNTTKTANTKVHELTGIERVTLHIKRLQFIYRVGYSVSLIFLVVAVVTMVSLRKLRCQRNTIHLNLFISFILRCIVCFIKDEYGIPEGESTTMENVMGQMKAPDETWGCKLTHTLFFYILVANYMWIFAEGMYLHSLIFVTTFHDISSKTFKMLVVIGWVSPIVCIVPWVITRLNYENTLCWNLHDHNNGFQWIIEAPIMLTLFINFLFFVNIIRVLFTKLSATHSRDPKCYRKLAKSTLVLIPLFGVHYMVFNAIPICLDQDIEIVWLYLELTLSSFQGFVVSLLFCFFNGEVKSEIRKHWRMHTLRRQSLVSSRSTRTFSIQSSDQESPKFRDKRDSCSTSIRHNQSFPNSWGKDNVNYKMTESEFRRNNSDIANSDASELSKKVKDDNENEAFLPAQKITFF